MGVWLGQLVALQVEVGLLRAQCADYIEQNQKDLMPFLLDHETGDTLSDGKQNVLRLERYVHSVNIIFLQFAKSIKMLLNHQVYGKTYFCFVNFEVY